MARLRLSLFGPLQVTLDGRPLVGFESDKVRALLAYLAVEWDRPHRRESLIGLLWPELPDRTARHNLSQALFNLRRVLSDQDSSSPFLLISRDTIQFNSASDHWVDVTEFTTLISAYERHRLRVPESGFSGSGFSGIDHLQRAIELYHGSFMDGFSLDDSNPFEEWSLLKRERLSQQAADALYSLAEFHEQRGEYEQALRYAWRQVELDSLQERAHRQLMRSYTWIGRRAAALRQYHECVRVLEAELGVSPSEETTRLYEAIKESRLSPPAAAPQPQAVSRQEDLAESTKEESGIFVARERELARLEDFLEAAFEGRGQVVFVVGEAGSGKTSLLQAFARRVQEAHSGVVVASGNCNAHTGLGDPYLPFREVLGLLTGDVGSRVATGVITGSQVRLLRDLLPSTVRALVDVSPDLIDTFVPGQTLLSRAAAHAFRLGFAQEPVARHNSGFALPGAPACGGVRASTGVRPEWLVGLEKLVERKVKSGSLALEQARLFEQYAELLRSLSQQQPLLLLLDDLQWADVGSVSLLSHLGRYIERSRILIVGAYRAEDVALGRDKGRHPLERVANEFKRAFGDIWVDLDKVIERDGRHFVDAILDTEPNRLGQTFRDALAAQTGGHPLFTLELLRDMQGRGDLIRNEDGQWVEGPSLDWETLPARVEGAIGERIGRLDEPLREMLAVASVEGETFTAEVIARVQGADERRIVRRLSGELDRQHHLVRAESVRGVGRQRLSYYRFRHFLIQKYLYSHLDAVERAYLHEDVGEVLEKLYGEQSGEIAVQLARHFQEAGKVAKAVSYLARAGDRAMRLYAYAEATTLFSQGLALLRKLPDTSERAQQELTLQISLGVPLSISKGFAAPEVERVFARARALCQQMGDAPDLFPALWGLHSFYLHRGQDRAMAEMAEQLMQIAQNVPDRGLSSVAHWAMGVTLLYKGELSPALHHLEQTISYYDPQLHRSPSFLYTTDPGVACLFWSAWVHWLLGYPDQAQVRIDEAMAVARKLSHPFSLAYAHFTACSLHQYRREAKKVLEQAEKVEALSTEHGFPFLLGLASVFRGWALAEQGETEEGIRLMRKGLSTTLGSGAKIGLPHMLSMLAEAHGRAGQVREGLTLLAEGLAAAHDSGERHYDAELHRLKGELLLALPEGSRSEAESSFRQAIDIARRQQAKSWELRATISLSRLWQSQRRGEEARALLAAVYGWFKEGFDTPDLREACRLLASLA